jgi:hypothetical protein
VIDGQQVLMPEGDKRIFAASNGERIPFFKKRAGKWELLPDEDRKLDSLTKHRGLEGPIDDAFTYQNLLIVEPTGKSRNPQAQAWVDFELAHFRDRWRSLMRGELPIKKDTEVTDADLEQAGSVVLWGDPDSNRLMSRLLEKSLVKFAAGKWSLGDVSYDFGSIGPYYRGTLPQGQR